MADRKLELGSFKALGADLGVSATTARRLVMQGPPKRWSDEELERFAIELYRRADVASRSREPAEREELQRRRNAPVFSVEAQREAARALSVALIELEKRRPCESGLWSPRVALARALGVTSVRLGRWLAAMRVPSEAMPAYVEWAQARVDRAIQKLSKQGTIERLLRAARKPELERQLSNSTGPRKQKVRTPDVKSGEGRTESEQQSGYQWLWRIEDWSDFDLVDRMYEWARTRRRPPGLRANARNWIVTALCSVYERKDGGRSPGAYREFEEGTEREIGRNLQIGVPVSSRKVSHGGLERAAKLWRAEMIEEHCENEFVFVHGIIVRNWRDRTEDERRNYRERFVARELNRANLAAAKRESKRKVVRARSKKKALGRRGSAAGSTATKATRAPAGARSRKKKRS